MSYYPVPVHGLPDDTIICPRQDVELSVPAFQGATYKWSNGATGTTTTYSSAGTASLHIYTPCDSLYHHLQIVQDDCEAPELYIPNSFTPNGDGLNDVFEIVNLPRKNSLRIFSRWGEMMYEASPYQNNWAGTTSKGQPMKEGVYVYQLRYSISGGEKEEMGWVNIINSRE
ncbi:MAG: gliding motility-associated C-terminal domain-containing protein [Owenweeksia sp.]|nr:gliding motility-associated C-terminal domain-containing protein [Owenweeksia sp.]